MATTQEERTRTTVAHELRGDVAVLTLANPPVNGLSDLVRCDLAVALDQAAQDDAVRAVVVTGDGSGFCGGADLRQMGTPASTAEPTIADVIQQLVRLPKPVVAAIHGFALGGGYELALACSHRIAHRDAVVGLPEVGVGIIPGAGGTQRLPRLVGAGPALELIQGGARVPARRAVELGMVDEAVDGDVVAAAVDLVAERDLRGPQPRVDDLPVAPTDGVDLEAARASVRPRVRNALAQREAVTAVTLATREPIAAGLAAEREIFLRLVASPEAAALRHVFLAERRAARVDDVDPTARPRTIDSVAIIGAGTMGSGIAMAFADAGIPVALVERDASALERALATVRRAQDAAVAKGRIGEDEAARRLDRITPGTDIASVAGADLVLEAVYEDLEVKRAVLAEIAAVAGPTAVIATNTSRLDVDELARATGRPQDVVGLHFFSPAHVMRLLEVVRGELTSDEVVVTALDLARRIGKVPVLARVGEGFIGNRMLTPYRREADFLLEEGATPQQVDRALEAAGMAMGPFRVADLAGLDIAWAARQRLAPTRDPEERYSRIADELCEAGRLGQKTGSGYYRYEGRQPVPDPEVEAVIRRCAEADGIGRREVGDEEIVDRCLLALVNEGALLLDEGIAQRASDIDVVWVDGYGFPAALGGPMHWATTLGLAECQRRITELERVHGSLAWRPAPLLQRLVARGATTWE